ncbi:MAG: SDR family NAD(P)-dependent oxidoreductase [Pseudomonadota bacterium]
MIELSSSPDPFNAAVIGATGGIGHAFVQALLQDDKLGGLVACSRNEPAVTHEKLAWAPLDITDEATIEAAATAAKDQGPFQLIVCATGILHGDDLTPEKSYRTLEAEHLQRVFSINTIGPALVAKHFLPLLAPKERAVFAILSARVGSIGDNRLGGWHGYRASKAALNMMIRNFAIETGRRHNEMICVGLHPGTVDTGLSKPFQGNVAPEKLFTPEQSVRHLLQVIDGLTPADSGGCLAWDGKKVPF